MKTRRLVAVVKDEAGTYLVGRAVGAEFRKQFFSGPPESWPKTLDFSGVLQATESCLDEVFGTLAKQHGAQAVVTLNIRGASRQVGAAIKYVLELVENPPPPLTRHSAEVLLRQLSLSRAGVSAGRRANAV